MKPQHFISKIVHGSLVLFTFLLYGCNCEFQISDILSAESKVYIGETVNLSVDVHNPDNCDLKYFWKTSNGEMKPVAGFPNSKFIAPCESGLNSIILEIQNNKGKTLLSKNIEIETIEKKQYDISTDYVPSGFFDDVNSIRIRKTEYQGEPCTEFTFNPSGRLGHGGVYWQYPPDNWGQWKGKKLEGYQRVSFFVSSPDNATINFISGGINDSDLPNKDKYKKSTGFKKLNSNWGKLEIDLRGSDLSSVIGGLAWTTNRDFNPRTVRFYIRDIIYDRYPCE